MTRTERGSTHRMLAAQRILISVLAAAALCMPTAAAFGGVVDTDSVPYWPSQRQDRLREIGERTQFLERTVLVNRAKADRARVLGNSTVEQEQTARADGFAAELAPLLEERQQLEEMERSRLMAEEERPAGPRKSFPIWDRSAAADELHVADADGVPKDEREAALEELPPAREPGSRGKRERPQITRTVASAQAGLPLVHLMPLVASTLVFLFFSPFAKRSPRVESRRAAASRSVAIAAESTSRQVAAATAAHEAAAAARSTRVLIADDSPTTRSYLAGVIGTTRGLELVGEAVNGLQAMAMTVKLKPDVVVMDLEMPIMNGFEATIAIMDTVPTPVIAVSSDLDVYATEVARRALGAGAVAVLEKPAGPGTPDHESSRRRFVDVIEMMAHMKVKSRSVPSDGLAHAA